MCEPMSEELKLQLQKLWSDDEKNIHGENIRRQMVGFIPHEKGLVDAGCSSESAICNSATTRQATPN